MISTSEQYIRGFVESCYQAGFHEKQAAVLLYAAQERERGDMTKQAGGVIGTLAKLPFTLGGKALKLGARGAGKFIQGGAKPLDKAIRTGIVGAGGLGAIAGGAAYGNKLYKDFRNGPDTGIRHRINNIFGTDGGGGGVANPSAPYVVGGAGSPATPYEARNEGWGADPLPDTPMADAYRASGQGAAPSGAGTTAAPAPVGAVRGSDEGPINEATYQLNEAKAYLQRQDAHAQQNAVSKLTWSKSPERIEAMQRISDQQAALEAARSKVYGSRTATAADIQRRISEANTRISGTADRLGNGMQDYEGVRNDGLLNQWHTKLKELTGSVPSADRLRGYQSQLEQDQEKLRQLQAEYTRMQPLLRNPNQVTNQPNQ